MNLRDLHYLVTVADSGQFARAAKLCHVSQPSLSMQLKKLEEELGVSIFERSGRELIITPTGRALIEHARSALAEVDQMRMIARHFSGQGAEFRLGIIPTVAPYLLPEYLPRIRSMLPKLKLKLVEAQTASLETSLKKGELDGIILSFSDHASDFATATLYHEPCLLAVPMAHKLARYEKVGLKDIAGEQVLLLEEGHCLRNHVLILCHRQGLQENVDFRATSLETLRHMVACGEGITIMPESAMRKDDGLAYIPCHEVGFTREIRIAWRQSTPHRAIIDQLINLASNNPESSIFYKNSGKRANR